tara:strand:+ start:46851 stop:47153 length:303 start_codon:yes stop_codon:yes gene_type:complete
MNEKKRNKEDQKVGEIIDKMFKAYGLSDKMKEMDIVNGWEEIMGKAVSNRTEKVFISNKVLHIKLNSSVMRDELSHGKQVIIERINQYAGENIIDDVWFE